MRQEAEAFINEVFDWLDEEQNKINFLIEKTQSHFGNQSKTQKLIEKLEKSIKKLKSFVCTDPCEGDTKIWKNKEMTNQNEFKS